MLHKWREKLQKISTFEKFGYLWKKKYKRHFFLIKKVFPCFFLWFCNSAILLNDCFKSKVWFHDCLDLESMKRHIWSGSMWESISKDIVSWQFKSWCKTDKFQMRAFLVWGYLRMNFALVNVEKLSHISVTVVLINVGNFSWKISTLALGIGSKIAGQRWDSLEND